MKPKTQMFFITEIILHADKGGEKSVFVFKVRFSSHNLKNVIQGLFVSKSQVQTSKETRHNNSRLNNTNYLVNHHTQGNKGLLGPSYLNSSLYVQ